MYEVGKRHKERRVVWANVTLVALLLLWDIGGWDMALARLSGSAHGFPLKEHWFLTYVLHEGGRRVSWALALLLCLAVWWPIGWMNRLRLGQRLQLAASTLIAVMVVAFVKAHSRTSCPWDLADFGGLAHYVRHWSGFWEADGGVGRCFPAGHASSAFAFVGGFFVFRDESPGIARLWLGLALAAGLALGLAQQLRGAHFMSHTLWSGALCWFTCWALDAIWRHTRRLQPPYFTAVDL
jgi:membrane-associated PAP2 superfamily phosphatase